MTVYEEYHDIFKRMKDKIIKDKDVLDIEHKNFINDWTTMIMDYNLEYLINTPYTIITTSQGYFSIMLHWNEIALMSKIVEDVELFLNQGFLFYTLIIIDDNGIDMVEDIQKYNKEIFDF